MTNDERVEARRQIVAAANKQRQRTNAALLNVAHATGRPLNLLPPFTSRSLQRAVCVCRRQGLVTDAVLHAAGFRSVAA